MAKLPTASQIDRPVLQPGAPRTGVVSYTPRDGQGLQILGKELGDVAAKMEEQQDDLDAAHVGSEFTVAYAKRLNALDSDQDFATMPERYTTDMNATKDQLLANVKNPRKRAELSARLDGVIAGGLDNVFSKQRQRKIEYGKADTARKGDELLPLMAGAKTIGDFNALYGSYEEDTKAKVGAGLLDPLEGYNSTKKLKESAAETWLELQPIQDRLKYLTPKKEGDGGGAIPNFNADMVKPYTTQRIEQVRELVAKPSEYDAWFDEAGAKYGVDPKELKLRAAVESGLKPAAQGPETPYGQSGGLMQLETETAKKLGVTDRNDPKQSIFGAAALLAEHQKAAGGDQTKVDKLYYAGSEGKMGPNTEQYAANLAAVRGGAAGGFAQTGTPTDFIPVEKRAELYQKTLTQAETEYKLRRDDPAKYGAKYGMTLDQTVQMQGDTFSASVIPKDEAKSSVADMNNFQNINDVVGTATKLQQDYGPYSENALRDLKRAGMKPPFEAAIVLSLQNPVAYKEHVELLSQVGISGEKSISPLFKERGYDNKKLEKLITDKTEEWSLMRSNEGMTLNEHGENIDVISALAQAKMIKDGTGDYDAAVKFAMQPEVDGFSAAALNGAQYRIPNTDRAGGKYDINAIEERVASAYADMLPQIAEANKKKGFHLSDAIIPYLNKAGDGLEFMTPIREPILDKDGNRFTLKFDDVIANESREERIIRIRKELESIPYGERDAYREKAFGIKIRPQKNVPAEAR